MAWKRPDCTVSLYFTCLSLAIAECSFGKKDSYPELKDIITFSDENINHLLPPDVLTKNYSMNIEKIDMEKFKRNQGAFMKQILGFNLNMTGIADRNASRGLEESRRNIPYHNWPRAYETAISRQTFTRIADIMLQTIFMARHKIKLLESQASYKKETIAYRIAFLYEKLRVTAKKINTIYSTMDRYKRQIINRWKAWLYFHQFLYLHHKAARVHVDFLYMWWVYIKMYDKHATKTRIPNTTPKDYDYK